MNGVSKICYSCDDQLEEVKESGRRKSKTSHVVDGEISEEGRWTNRGKVENEYEIFLDLDEIWIAVLIVCANANENAKNDVQGERKSDDVLKLRVNEVDEKQNFEESSRPVEEEENDRGKQVEGMLRKNHECSR